MEAERKVVWDVCCRNLELGMMETRHRLRKRGYYLRPESLFRVMNKLGLFPRAEKKLVYRPY